MKIKHYRAPDMRQALRQVREAQGPDAVILSSHRVNGGVEVVAAVDYDGDDVGVDNYGQHERGPLPVPPPATGGGDRARVVVASPSAFEAQAHRARHDTARAGNGAADRSASAASSSTAFSSPPPFHGGGQGGGISASDYATLAQRFVPNGESALGDTRSDVNEELRTLRRMLETQLATLAWNDLSRRAPIQTELLKQLTVLGLAHDLAAELVAQMPGRQELAEAHRSALALISRRIEVADERWMDSGGVVAMIGPTGVGKTTLVAKLAARWVLRHGPRDLAIISTDSVRIGAQEQIHTLGRLLGAQAFAIDGIGELPKLLEHLGSRRFVLIDTAGLSQRDARLAPELAMLGSSSDRLETSLVMSAAAQAGAMEETVEQFEAGRPATCMLTKLDEATSLGGALSVLIRTRLPVAYVSEGQRVPEDLLPARAHQLVARAVELSRRSGAAPDEDLLRRRFGSVAHAIA